MVWLSFKRLEAYADVTFLTLWWPGSTSTGNAVMTLLWTVFEVSRHLSTSFAFIPHTCLHTLTIPPPPIHPIQHPTPNQSIMEVFLLCMAGYILARLDIIDKQTQRKINVVQVTLLTPCLMTSKIAFSLTREKLKEMWIIPIGWVYFWWCGGGWWMGSRDVRESNEVEKSLWVGVFVRFGR
jgi:hypothetical protein